MTAEVETVSIPVVEEELKLGRETVETGRVKVRTVPQERSESIVQQVLRTDVVIGRARRDQEVTAIPPVRHEGDTIIVPIVEERLVKRLFLVEEVRLTRRASTAEVDQQIKLRSQRVIVEREKSSGGPPNDDQE